MIDSMSRWLVGSSSSSASGLHQQDARQRHAHLPAAGERADVAVHHLLREAEAGEDLARARLERVAAELLEARLHLAEALDQRLELVGARRVGQRVLELVQLCADLGHRARAVHRLRDHAPALHLADVLAEVADGHAAVDGRPGRRRAAPRRRSAGRWWSCRSRWGRPAPPSRRWLSAAEASRKRICWPCCLLTESRRIMGGSRGPGRWAGAPLSRGGRPRGACEAGGQWRTVGGPSASPGDGPFTPGDGPSLRGCPHAPGKAHARPGDLPPWG